MLTVVSGAIHFYSFQNNFLSAIYEFFISNKKGKPGVRRVNCLLTIIVVQDMSNKLFWNCFANFLENIIKFRLVYPLSHSPHRIRVPNSNT